MNPAQARPLSDPAAAGAEAELAPLPWEPTDSADLGSLLRSVEPVAPQSLDRADLIDSRADFHAAIRSLLRDAIDGAATDLWLCDRDFSGWPLGDRDVVELLATWLDSQRRLTLVASHYDWLVPNAPRFIAWRNRWSHAIDCLIAHSDDGPRLPSLLLWPERQQLRLSDSERVRGRRSDAAVDLTASAELIDAAMQRAQGNLAPTTLGL